MSITPGSGDISRSARQAPVAVAAAADGAALRAPVLRRGRWTRRSRRTASRRICRKTSSPPGTSSAPNMNKVTPEGGRFWDAEHR